MAASRAMLALGLALLGLHVMGCLARAPKENPSRTFVVALDNMAEVFAQVATADGVIIFTTLQFDANNTGLDMVQNFCYWLDQQSLLPNTMIFSTDEHSWRTLHSKGLPGYLDRSYSLPETTEPGSFFIPNTDSRVFDLSKSWWGLQIIKHGYKALYLDADNIVMQDPMKPFDIDYDVQGLSDWLGPELPPTGVIGHDCGLYKWAPSDAVPYGAALTAHWHLNTEKQKQGALPVPNPCQSTGGWYIKPSPTAIAFLEHFQRQLRVDNPTQWEQTAWNEVILGYLMGMGDGLPPLRYRLLPVDKYSSILVHNDRKKAGLPVDQVIMHAAPLHGDDKAKAFIDAGLYHPTFEATSAAPDDLRARLQEQMDAYQRSHGGLAWAPSASALVGALAVLGCAASVFLWAQRRRGQSAPDRYFLGVGTPKNSP